jgi:methylenetetrahydrofolate reductase (NADPH)
MTKVKTKLAQSLSAGKWVLTAECLPPAGGDPVAMKKLASQFAPALDAVVVVENHHETRGSALACAALLAAERIEPVLPLSTRDKNRIALESDVLGAAALGVKNVLCLTGLHQRLGASWKAAGVYDLDSTQLVQALGMMTEQGLGLGGTQLGYRPELFVGATAHPFLTPIELSILQLKKKIMAGAEVVWTDPIFDVAGFETWMAAVRASGLDKKVAIIASVLPLTGVAHAEQQRKRPGTRGIDGLMLSRLGMPSHGLGAGVGICAEIIAALRKVPGVRGLHLMTGGSEALASQIMSATQLA